MADPLSAFSTDENDIDEVHGSQDEDAKHQPTSDDDPDRSDVVQKEIETFEVNLNDDEEASNSPQDNVEKVLPFSWS